MSVVINVYLPILIDLLGILELVRPHCLVPVGSCGWRNRIPWFDGDVWGDLQLLKSNSRPSGYSQRLRYARSSVQWFDSMGNLHVRCILLCYIERPSQLSRFTYEMKDESAGLLAAILMGIVPGYISRSVAGSYDNEAIAIFLLMFTFWTWIRAMKQGSAFYGTITAIFYFYMVAAWGGYVFITNMIPLHAFVLVLMGRFSPRLYVAYSSWYAVGTLASMQVPFVGFQPVRTSEHMAALGVFGLLQLVAFTELVRSHVSSKQFKFLLRTALVAVGLVGFAGIVVMTMKGWIAPWTGRFYSLWDTGYAKK